MNEIKEALEKRILKIIEEGDYEELRFLPELINSLMDLSESRDIKWGLRKG